MRRILLITVVALVPMTATATMVRENIITIWSTTICWARETSRIFTFPSQIHHTMTIHSTHYGTDVNNKIIDLHPSIGLGFDTDAIEADHDEVYGIWARKVHMDTDFYTERCIANGIVEMEITRHTEEDC